MQPQASDTVYIALDAIRAAQARCEAALAAIEGDDTHQHDEDAADTVEGNLLGVAWDLRHAIATIEDLMPPLPTIR
jgi:hypothetical protein